MSLHICSIIPSQIFRFSTRKKDNEKYYNVSMFLGSFMRKGEFESSFETELVTEECHIN
jgi:hypothetical protein